MIRQRASFTVIGGAILLVLGVVGCSSSDSAVPALRATGGSSGGGGRGAGGQGGASVTAASGGAIGSPGEDAGIPGNSDGSRDAVGDMPGSDPGGDAGSSPDAAGTPSFAAVQVIFATSCVRCHDPAHPFVPEAVTFVGLDLTSAGAYAALVGRAATETCGGVLVTPGAPDRSYLFHKLTDATPCEGKRMPHPGMLAFRPPLPDPDLATIAAWISSGAKR